ncbi:MAG: hypothetical protein C5B49_08985 [Bdellovibrio sp.]|nr:MAG: hypothetical protein C5B49_08985 [Bdellovibrio sp.]
MPLPVPTPSTGTSALADETIQANINTPIQFTGQLATNAGNNPQAAVTPTGGTVITTSNGGTLKVIDPNKLTFEYTPGPNFRGEDSATVYLVQNGGKTTSATIRIQVDNSLVTLKPAIAVRGTGCITCHASIGSNIVTDFGFGDPYFFGGPTLAPTDHTSIYSDESTDPSWKYLSQLGPQVIVPVAPTTSLAKVKAPSLAAYLRGVLAGSSIPSVRNSTVTEVSSVYIGAPTADRIRQVGFLNPPETFKYAPDYNQPKLDPNLSSFSQGGTTVYQNNGSSPMVCSGDIIIDGILVLNRPIISSQTGCRIYVTQSVFLYGPITFSGGNPSNENLQIVSARSINLGLGTNTCSAPNIGANSLTYRLQVEDRRKFYFTRGEPQKTVQQKLDDIVADANVVGMNSLVDAACEPQFGRSVSFDRLILNAPIVFSRYQGGFTGSVIAEVALMSLNTFVFQFDEIFSSQPVLPLLRQEDYLMIKQ